MTQAYFLVPGLLLDESVKDRLSKETLELAGRLSTNLASDPIAQELGEGVFSRSNHLSWIWSVLMRRALPPQTAAYAWPVDQGPQFCSNDVYNLNAAHIDEAGVVHAVELSDAAVEALAKCITPALTRMDFKLQRWDKVLYLTRKDTLSVYARPFEALVGHVRNLSEDLECVTEDEALGEKNLTTFVEDLKNLEALVREADISVDGVAINALWIDGASRYANVYPPTTIRSVLTDDATVFGWGLAAGILNHRLGKLTAATEWPSDAPSGERIALVDGLYKAWLAKDWDAWQKALPAVVDQFEKLSESARKKGCDEALIVACGEGLTVSIARKLTNPKSLLARFSSGKKLASDAWLFSGRPQSGFAAVEGNE